MRHPGLILALALPLLLGAVPSAAVREQYQKRLAQAPEGDGKARAELAAWCLASGLRQEGEDLYRAVLEKEPDHAAARKALGYQKVAGEWLDAEGRKRRELLLEAEGGQGAPSRMKLAGKARAAGFPDLEKRFLEEVVALEPDHASARRGLGQTRFEDAWRPDAELLAEYVSTDSGDRRKVLADALKASGWTAERMEKHRRWAAQPKGEQKGLPLEGKGYKTVYILRVPEDYDGLRLLPLVVFLHGGGPGMVCEPESVSAFGRFMTPVLPGCIAAFPKSPYQEQSEMWCSEAGEVPVLDLISKLCGQYPVDPRRIYLTGCSRGGWGTLYIAGRHPERFAAAGAACPECLGVDAQGLKKLPVFLAHGDKDEACDVNRTRALDADLTRLGGLHRYLEVAGAGHALPDEAMEKLFAWIAGFPKP